MAEENKENRNEGTKIDQVACPQCGSYAFLINIVTPMDTNLKRVFITCLNGKCNNLHDLSSGVPRAPKIEQAPEPVKEIPEQTMPQQETIIGGT